MSISAKIEIPVFRKFVPDTSKVEDPFVDQCKAVLHSEGLCPPPHPRWADSLHTLVPSPPLTDAMRPALQRTNSILNPGFFEHPIIVDGKKTIPILKDSQSTPIHESIVTVRDDMLSPNSENRSEPVIEVDCRDVEKMRKKKWRWCGCLK